MRKPPGTGKARLPVTGKAFFEIPLGETQMEIELTLTLGPGFKGVFGYGAAGWRFLLAGERSVEDGKAAKRPQLSTEQGIMS